MSCTERDHIILAFALAANEGNIAAEEVEHAASDGERQNAQKAVETARNYCHHSARGVSDPLRATRLLTLKCHGVPGG